MRIIRRIYNDYSLYAGMHKGVLSILLGLALLIDPDDSSPKLMYWMGMFWLVSGFGLLRQKPDERLNSCLSKLISVVAMVTGLLVVLRYYTDRIFGVHVVEDTVAGVVLGTVILLTGLSHLVAEWKGGESSEHRVLHMILAVFETLLGVQLLLLPMVEHTYVRQTISAWALIGGILFISTAYYDHTRRNRESKVANSNAAGEGTENKGLPGDGQDQV